MATPIECRDSFIDTLDHVKSAFDKVQSNSGKTKTLSFPDMHKISEGLYLSAWTYWEAFTRRLLMIDLSTDAAGRLRKDIKKFRTANAPSRLAELVLNHPDHPDKFVDWSDYNTVQNRANALLAAGHRYVKLPRAADLVHMKKIRNAVAHRSDKAWSSFTSMAKKAPFNLTAGQTKGITPGRFLSSHKWGATVVLVTAVTVLEESAKTLVP